jgi:hypothetical protein
MIVLRHRHTERTAGERVIVLYFPFRQMTPMRGTGQIHVILYAKEPFVSYLDAETRPGNLHAEVRLTPKRRAISPGQAERSAQPACGCLNLILLAGTRNLPGPQPVRPGH